MARIERVGHVVLGVRNPRRFIALYTEALGMELVLFLDEPRSPPVERKG